MPFTEGESAEAQESNVFELEARLYSGTRKAFVGRVVMRYSGDSQSEAFTLFSQKLSAAFPGLTCGGWAAP